MPPGARADRARVRAVLFDVDDTLFDHRYASRAGLAALRRTHPALRTVDFATVDRRYRRLLESSWFRRVLAGEITPAESRRHRMRALFRSVGVRLGPDAATEVVDEYRRAYGRHRRAVPGAAAVLDELGARARIAAVSNNFTRDQAETLGAVGLLDRIDRVIGVDVAGCAKPDPRIYRRALAEVGARPGEAVMVGDNWTADVVGAHRAGIRPVWFRREPGKPPVAPPAAVIRSFRPTAPAVERILGPMRGPLGRARP